MRLLAFRRGEESQCQISFPLARQPSQGQPINRIDAIRVVLQRRFKHPVTRQPGLFHDERTVHQIQCLRRHGADVAPAQARVRIGEVEHLEQFVQPIARIGV